MSLNFDLTACKTRLGDRWDEITTSPDTRDKPEGERKWHGVTDALIWASMAVDLGSITEDNVDEWCFRLGLLGRCNEGIGIGSSLGKFDINRNDIVNHIGMRTNVTTKPRNAWVARIFSKDSYDAKAVSLKPTQEPSAAERFNAAYADYVKTLTVADHETVE